MKKQRKQKKLDVNITPLRLSVVIGGLTLIFLDEFFQWNIPWLMAIFGIAVLLSIVLTQPKDKK